jgi:hypothetical protein
MPGLMPSDDYVSIVRHVRELGEEGTSGTISRKFLRALRSDGETTLASLLDANTLDPVVLVAPSGTGKTAELRHHASRLRAAGRSAAFAEALGILAPSQMDLDPDEQAAFKLLLESPTPGVLFVDALDELHLRHLSFEQLFRRLEREIGFEAHPTRLIFSARNGAWTPSATRELRRLLKRIGVDGPKLVTFEQLDLDAIKKLAAAYGILDVDAFLAEFEEEEIDDLLELRPADVKLLAELRKRGGRLSKWTQLLQEFIDASFVDERHDRNRGQHLSSDVAHQGLERIAAAALLMKVPHVSTPSVALGDGAISSRQLFADWSTSQLTEFFEHPLFVHKGREAEAVQLPQGPLSHFLAARWFAGRVRGGLRAEALRAALLVKVPGNERFEIPEAHHKLVGWLSSEVPEFRALIAQEHPAIVLYEGDPDRLSDAEIREGLGRLCNVVDSGRWDGWATPATIRRLARSSLEGDVGGLLKKYGANPKVAAQLLKLVEQGKYPSCADVALELATTSPDSLTRFVAIMAFAAAAPEGRSKLVALTGDEDEHVRLALLQTLVPDLLQGRDLVRFVLAGGGHTLRHGLKAVAHKISTRDLDALVRALAPILRRSTVSASTGSAFEAVVPILQARLERGGTFDGRLIRALAAVEQLRHDHVSMNMLETEERPLAQLLSRHEGARRKLWRLRFADAAASPNAFINLLEPHFGNVEVTDLRWLWTLSKRQREPRRRHAVLHVLDRLWSRLPPNECNAVLVDRIPSKLRHYLESRSTDQRGLEEKRRIYDEGERSKEEELRRKNAKALGRKRRQIESGDDLHTLEWAWSHLVGKGSENTRLSPERLRRYVGEDYVQLFLRGLRACWRKIDVPVPQPGKGKAYRYLLGLTGVALSVRDGLEFSTLSQPEARRAARFGLYELNSFPFWFGELALAHSEEVRLALTEALTLEWKDSKGNHGVLRLASRADRAVSEIVRDVVLDLLEMAPPAHSITVDYAVDAILTSKRDLPRVVALVRREIDRSGADAPDAHWLRLWAHVEPERAGDWIVTRMAGDREGTMPLLLKMAALLERDLDDRLGRTTPTAFMSPRSLAHWARLLLSFVAPADDVRHVGVYHPGDRDHAQDLRNRCLTRLSSDPSAEARALLLSMLADPSMSGHRAMLEGLLASQRTVAIEAAVSRWTEDDILRVERNDEKLPRTLHELFELVQHHLLHLHDLLANDDFSYRGLFAEKGGEKTDEREIQLWVASCLRQRSRGLYSVVRENVVDDDKEVDISAFAAGIGHVPIEIKPLGSYSASKLENVMEVQLLGQYMQPPDRRCGILLVVRRDERRWRLGGREVELEVLVEHLRSFGRDLGARHGKDIRVAVIDLLARPAAAGTTKAATKSRVTGAKRPGPSRNRRATKTRSRTGVPAGRP